jgi:hypothetical protein
MQLFKSFLIILLLSTSFFASAKSLHCLMSISNQTKSYYLFNETVTNFLYNIQNDVELGYTLLPFSNSTLISKNKYLDLASYVKKNIPFLIISPESFSADLMNNDRILDKKIWIESTIYDFNLKTKKANIICQIIFEFEGTDAEQEKQNPKIKNIILKTKLQCIDRKSYLKNLIHKENYWKDFTIMKQEEIKK